MAKWSAGTESGILRKKVVKDKHEDLLVFGYACKLFRDDEKALYIDQGKHLIPWMGNDDLKIDRYDCRGALSELIQYEANREDYDTLRWLGLKESERRIEVLCDEERYYSLKHNEEELEMYKEEELKRLHQKSNEVQYNYDVPADPENSQEAVEASEKDEEAFVPPTELNVPDDIEVPKTVKENARIEKTAAFISKQGLQMEILIKTKQADNPQFNFMNKEDKLYKYYKHLIAAIKSGQYKVHFAEEDTSKDQKHDESGEHDGQDEHYLHPSLLATSIQSTPSPMPTLTYKPSADCAYSQLVNRIQGTQSESATSVQPPPEVSQSPVVYEQQQYYQQYYYAAQYYEYYKQMAQQFQGQPPDKLPQDGSAFAQSEIFTTNQNASIPNQLNMQNILQSQAAYMQYLQQQHQQQSIANPYAQIVSNLSHNKDLSSEYNNFIQAHPNQNLIQQNSEITKAPILYGQKNEQQNIQQNIPPSQNLNIPPDLSNQAAPSSPQNTNTHDIARNKEKNDEATQESAKEPPLLSIAQYGSDTEDENEEAVKAPPGEMKQIIDKMASYVLKNGKDFENIVKSKGDTRFEFLNENHVYHPYYILKIKESSENGSDDKVEEENNVQNKELYNGTANKFKEKKVVTPVCFSIKKSKDEVPKEIKSALPIEESDDDHEDSSTAKTPPILPTSVISDLPPCCNCYTFVTASISNTSPSLTNTTSTILTPRSINRTPPLKEPPLINVAIDDSLSRLQGSDNEKQNESDKLEEVETIKVSMDSDDLILEMIDLTDDLEEKREMRRVEDRKKDKIAAAAREKLALQLERKKKAAAFLKLKSVETVSSSDKNKVVSRSEKSTSKKSNKSKNDLEMSIKHSSRKRSRSSKTKDKNDEEVLRVDDSESEEGEIKKHKKQNKKKSHKRKHSRNRHESRSRHKNKEHKKSKKRRRRSNSGNSDSSTLSQ